MKFPLTSLTPLNTNYQAPSSLSPLPPSSSSLPLIPLIHTCLLTDSALSPLPKSVLATKPNATHQCLQTRSHLMILNLPLLSWHYVFKVVPQSYLHSSSPAESLFRRMRVFFGEKQAMHSGHSWVNGSSSSTRGTSQGDGRVGRMEERIRDGEIKPLQPGDLCARLSAALQAETSQRNADLDWQPPARVHTCAHTCTRFLVFPAASLPPAASVSERDLRISPGASR